MKIIWIIFKKELKDTVRDRKAMFFMFIIPLLMFPLLMLGMISVQKYVFEKEKEKDIRIAYIDYQQTPDLLDKFDREKFKIIFDINIDDIESMLRADSLDIALIVENGFTNDIKSLSNPTIQLLYKSEDNFAIPIEKTKEVLNAYSNIILSERLEKLNIKKEVLNPFTIEEIDFASSREKLGKTIGGFLPYIFILFCFGGAMYPGIDLGAGEKERGTLETLLVAPAYYHEILIGKFGVICISGIVSAIISLLGLIFSVYGMQIIIEDIPLEILSLASDILKFKTMILLISLLIPVTVFFTSLILSLSIYSKSYKEAQSVIGPLNMVILFPLAIGSLVPGIKLNFITALIPILNIALSSKEVIAGTISLFLLFVVHLSSLIIAIISILICSYIFKREDIIFR